MCSSLVTGVWYTGTNISTSYDPPGFGDDEATNISAGDFNNGVTQSTNGYEIGWQYYGLEFAYGAYLNDRDGIESGGQAFRIQYEVTFYLRGDLRNKESLALCEALYFLANTLSDCGFYPYLKRLCRFQPLPLHMPYPRLFPPQPKDFSRRVQNLWVRQVRPPHHLRQQPHHLAPFDICSDDKGLSVRRLYRRGGANKKEPPVRGPFWVENSRAGPL